MRSPVDGTDEPASTQLSELLEMRLKGKEMSSKETGGSARHTEEVETPPILEMQTPGELVRTKFRNPFCLTNGIKAF